MEPHVKFHPKYLLGAEAAAAEPEGGASWKKDPSHARPSPRPIKRQALSTFFILWCKPIKRSALSTLIGPQWADWNSTLCHS